MNLKYSVFVLGPSLVRDPFSWDITGRNIMAMIIQGFVFFIFTLLIEYKFFFKPRLENNSFKIKIVLIAL